MNLLTADIPLLWLWASHALLTLILLYSLITAPWHLMTAKRSLVFFFVMLSLAGLWATRAGINPGMEYHYLGATLLALMFRWQFAFMMMFLLVVLQAAGGYSDWQTVSINTLVLGCLPVLISYNLYRLIEYKLPNHFFIYIFLSGFFNSALTLAVTVSSASFLMVLSGQFSLQQIVSEYLPYVALMIYPEAFLTGLLLTVMVVYLPYWVLTFDDRKYLNNH